MIVLAIDTCLGACTAAVLDGERMLAGKSEPMWRGHQERLASLVAEVMVEAGVPYAALQRVGATVGPGSFTGLRVGVAFAKGLSVALGIEAVGVGSLEGFAVGVPGRALAVADARRGQVYWQAFEDGSPAGPARVSEVELVPPLYGEGGSRSETGGEVTAPPPFAALRDPPHKGEGLVLLGPGAQLLAAWFPQAQVRPSDAATPLALGRLVAASRAPLAPLYLRPPDAKLPGGIDPFA